MSAFAHHALSAWSTSIVATTGAVWGIAGVAGPMLGGLIVHALSWHWVFFINIPFGVGSAAVLLVALHEGVQPRRAPFDISGVALLAATIVLLLLGGRSGVALAAWPLAGAALAGFIAVEKRAPDPVLPLDLLQMPVIAIASAAGALLGAAMIAISTFLPLYVQGVLGGSATEAGMAIAPMAVGLPLASAIAGRLLPRVGYRPLIRTGFVLAFVAALAMAMVLHPDTSKLTPRFVSALLGLGLGAANTVLLIAVQSCVAWGRHGVATATTMMSRMLGGAPGVGALGAMLSTALAANPEVPPEAAEALLHEGHGAVISEATRALVQTTLASGLGHIFWIIAAVAAAALAVSLLFPKIPLSIRTRLRSSSRTANRSRPANRRAAQLCRPTEPEGRRGLCTRVQSGR